MDMMSITGSENMDLYPDLHEACRGALMLSPLLSTVFNYV
jgi:hypothetical protein